MDRGLGLDLITMTWLIPRYAGHVLIFAFLVTTDRNVSAVVPWASSARGFVCMFDAGNNGCASGRTCDMLHQDEVETRLNARNRLISPTIGQHIEPFFRNEWHTLANVREYVFELGKQWRPHNTERASMVHAYCKSSTFSR